MYTETVIPFFSLFILWNLLIHFSLESYIKLLSKPCLLGWPSKYTHICSLLNIPTAPTLLQAFLLEYRGNTWPLSDPLQSVLSNEARRSLNVTMHFPSTQNPLRASLTQEKPRLTLQWSGRLGRTPQPQTPLTSPPPSLLVPTPPASLGSLHHLTHSLPRALARSVPPAWNAVPACPFTSFSFSFQCHHLSESVPDYSG